MMKPWKLMLAPFRVACVDSLQPSSHPTGHRHDVMLDHSMFGRFLHGNRDVLLPS